VSGVSIMFGGMGVVSIRNRCYTLERSRSVGGHSIACSRVRVKAREH
jgi:hypothetical protein